MATRGVNRAMVMGYVGQDPEVRKTKKDRSVVNLSRATKEIWKDAAGEQQERTDWRNAVIYGKAADVIKNTSTKAIRSSPKDVSTTAHGPTKTTSLATQTKSQFPISSSSGPGPPASPPTTLTPRHNHKTRQTRNRFRQSTTYRKPDPSRMPPGSRRAVFRSFPIHLPLDLLQAWILPFRPQHLRYDLIDHIPFSFRALPC